MTHKIAVFLTYLVVVFVIGTFSEKTLKDIAKRVFVLGVIGYIILDLKYP